VNPFSDPPRVTLSSIRSVPLDLFGFTSLTVRSAPSAEYPRKRRPRGTGVPAPAVGSGQQAADGLGELGDAWQVDAARRGQAGCAGAHHRLGAQGLVGRQDQVGAHQLGRAPPQTPARRPTPGSDSTVAGGVTTQTITLSVLKPTAGQCACRIPSTCVGLPAGGMHLQSSLGHTRTTSACFLLQVVKSPPGRTR